MARAYYSTVFPQSADDIWNAIRDFNSYPVWVDGTGGAFPRRFCRLARLAAAAFGRPQRAV